MEKQELIRRLMRTFLGELEGHLQAFDRDLMVLEQRPAPEARAGIINSLFRTAHSLKGSARAVNVEILEAAAHRLEFLFAVARDDAAELSPRIFQLLFATVDAMATVRGQLQNQGDVDPRPLEKLLADLQHADSGPRAPGDAAIAEQMPPPGIEDPWPTAGSPEPRLQGAAEPLAPSPAEPTPAEIGRTGFVRVASRRLDRMVALGGELLVARRRASSRKADLDGLLDKARKLEAGWRGVEKQLRGDRRDAKPSRGVRDMARTDERTGILAIERERLRSLIWQVNEFTVNLAADLRALDQVAEPLEAEIIRARMVPFSAACEGLGRAVRDLGHQTGKEVGLFIEGGDLEIDRSIVETLKSPLLHLVRNAVDHGIETRATRLTAGKPARGRVTISAALRRGGIQVTVADDGGGLDVAAIREEARRRGLPVPATEQELADLLFEAGFSTSPDVTVISGRGVGLDVVRTAIQAGRGSVVATSTIGGGTQFVISMPLSLSMLPVLLVAAGGQTYAFDCAAVGGMLRVGSDDVRAVGGRDTVVFDSAPIPLFFLADCLGRVGHDPVRPGAKVPVVVLAMGNDRAAFVVDELIAEQIVALKDLGPRLRAVSLVSGATILPTGRIALVLHAAELMAMARGRASSPTLSSARGAGPDEARKRLLVVDDSITTRTLVQSILEATGYDVTAAVDGMEAWRMLQEDGADLIVSDIEMPRMDGFALTEAIRASRRFKTLPVILVTALESDEDRMRGLDAGADAYLRKSSFDQTQLIETIRQLL